MARRRSKKDSDSDPALLIVGIVALFLISIARTLLGVLVTACAFLGLPCLVAVYVYRKEERDECPRNPLVEMPSPLQFDWLSEKAAIKRLACQLREIRKKIEDIYARGRKAGIRLTDASEGAFFDERTEFGQELNGDLRKEGQRKKQIKLRMGEQKSSVLARLPDWRLSRELRKAENSLRADAASAYSVGRIGIIAYIVTLIVALLLNAQWLQSLSSIAFLVAPPMQMLYGPAAVATVTGCIASAVARRLIHTQSDDTLDAEIVSAWWHIEGDIREADKLGIDETDNVERDDDEEPARGAEDAPDETKPRPWFEVLGVAESASAEEIKMAWRQRMREYHPDSVATRGPKLKDVAEQESVAVNQAYQHAQKLRRV